MRILVVDDEQVTLDSLKLLLYSRNFNDVTVCNNGNKAIKLIKENDFDVVLLDIIMPETDGLEVLAKAKPFKPETEFIILSAIDEVETSVKALRLGAYDYLVKPSNNDKLILTINHAYEHKGFSRGLAGARSNTKDDDLPEGFQKIITQDMRLKELISYIDIMARTDFPILITGETGTGKELISRGIHESSDNSKGPFVAINVSSVPETLFESHFFGHKKGAFSGAINDYKGYFEQASSGTLFLDEIGDLPYNLQSKILRALEEEKLTPIGDACEKEFITRIVSATNQDLDDACQSGGFRLDLLYRIKTVHIHLPPLRERKGDVPLLAECFLEEVCESHNKVIRGISRDALDKLSSYKFPGNIRELKQIITNSVFLADGKMINSRHLGLNDKTGKGSRIEDDLCTLRVNEDRHIIHVLEETSHDKKAASEKLGISIRQLNRKILTLKQNPQWSSRF